MPNVPWKGFMSIDWGFRQKVIRVFASAAITGLSISFIIGEVVDEKAHSMFFWKEDSQLIPAGYSPLKPLLASMNTFGSKDYVAELVAKNDATPFRIPMSLPTPVLLGLAPATDELQFIAAAPKAVHEVVVVPLKSLPAKVKNIRLALETERSLEQVKNSVGKVTQEIVGPTKLLKPVAENKDQTLKTVQLPKPVSDSGTKKLTEEATPVMETIAEVPATIVKKAIEVAPSSVKTPNSKSWLVSGQISPSFSTNKVGHFEVGLYTKIDPWGKPIGYPLIQEILQNGQTRFQIKAPGEITKAYIFAEYVAHEQKSKMFIPARGNPIHRIDLDGASPLFLVEAQDKIVNTAAAMLAFNNESTKIRGQVLTMFAPAKKPIPQNDVVVKIRGRKESVRTDKEGKFSLELAQKIKGVLTLEVLKSGYFPIIVNYNLEQTSDLNIELASRDAIDQIAQANNVRQLSSLGVLIGKVASNKESGTKGVVAQMNLRAEGPFYFEDGFPNRDLKSSSSDGRFIFFNVEPGVGQLDTSINGETLLPLPLSFVEGGQLVQKNLVPVMGKISGRVFTPVQTKEGRLNPISAARVHFMGETDSATTDSLGSFTLGPIKYFKGEPVTVEVSVEKFYSHRFTIKQLDKITDPMNLYVFPAAYINKLASSVEVSLNSNSAIILGKISGLGARVDAMSEHSTVNTAKDFYFDYKGHLRGSHTHTDPRFGTYVIFNVPRGGTLLQGNDSSGHLIYSDTIETSSSTVHVVLD